MAAPITAATICVPSFGLEGQELGNRRTRCERDDRRDPHEINQRHHDCENRLPNEEPREMSGVPDQQHRRAHHQPNHRGVQCRLAPERRRKSLPEFARQSWCNTAPATPAIAEFPRLARTPADRAIHRCRSIPASRFRIRPRPPRRLRAREQPAAEQIPMAAANSCCATSCTSSTAFQSSKPSRQIMTRRGSAIPASSGINSACDTGPRARPPSP